MVIVSWYGRLDDLLHRGSAIISIPHVFVLVDVEKETVDKSDISCTILSFGVSSNVSEWDLL
jgi:hypothetical protein